LFFMPMAAPPEIWNAGEMLVLPRTLIEPAMSTRPSMAGSLPPFDFWAVRPPAK
jgi:hypothetical protein